MWTLQFVLRYLTRHVTIERPSQRGVSCSTPTQAIPPYLSPTLTSLHSSPQIWRPWRFSNSTKVAIFWCIVRKQCTTMYWYLCWCVHLTNGVFNQQASYHVHRNLRKMRVMWHITVTGLTSPPWMSLCRMLLDIEILSERCRMWFRSTGMVSVTWTQTTLTFVQHQKMLLKIISLLFCHYLSLSLFI